MTNTVTEKIEVRREVAVDVKELWKVISSVGGVDKWWSGMILDCRIEGSGAGAKRYCTMANGAKLVETIIEIDQQRMAFTYEVGDNPALPMRSLRGTMQLTSLGDGRTEFAWRAEYEPRPEMPGAAKKMLEEVYPMGIDSLAAYCCTLRG